ncbi:MAG: TonB-dependent receptor [Candidatus Delongbacteria bacterium]|nr:TonB-dependent receptor [Candidatus Delongbacteria bacterium]
MKIIFIQYIPAYRRIFNLTAIFLFFISTDLFSGSRFTGNVTDKNNIPLQDVNIELFPTSLGTTTDENGYFSFARVDNGKYILKFSHVSFKPFELEALSGTADKLKLKIQLQNNNIELVPISVTNISLFSEKKIIPREEIERSNSSSLVDLIDDLSPISIEEVDGINTKVSIRGSDSKQVCIMVDGTIINSKMDGSFNINSIPVEIIDHIEIFKGGDISLTSQGMGGIINIVTKKEIKGKEFSLKYSSLVYFSDRDNLTFDRFNNNQISAMVSWPLKTGNLVLSYNNKRNENNWSYINAAKADEYRYINNPNLPRIQGNAFDHSDNFYTMYSANFKKINYGLVFNYSLVKYGMPGWYDLPYESAFMEKDDASYKIFYDQKLSSSAGVKIDISQEMGSKHVYINEIDSFYFADNTDLYDNRKIKLSTSFNNGSIISFSGIEYKREEVESEMIVGFDRFRENYSAFSKLEWTNNIFNESYKFHLLGGIRQEYFSSTKEFETLYSYGTFTEFLKGRLSLIPKFNYSRNYRLPTFSSMFWADNLYTSGNPDLKPEFSNMYDTSLSLSYINPTFTTSIYFTYYYKELEDLIVWIKKSNGRYIPENQLGGEISGIESGVDLSFKNLFKINLSLNTLSSKQFTDNVVTNEKKIIYKPDIMFTSKMDYSYGDINFSLSSKYNGHMFLNETNSIDIDPFWLHGMEIAYQCSINEHFPVNYYLKIDNMFDEQYQIIYGYPMPGRKIETGIKLKLK